ncbi:MAG: flagellar hook-length control protein FliK [Leptolinea sp.]
MNCADVMSLARAAPEPASTPRVNPREDGNSFDQFLQAATSDPPTSKEESIKTRSSSREETRDDQRVADTESVEPKQVDAKPVETKPAAKSETQEPAAVDESVKEIIAAAVAAQVLNFAILVQQPDQTVAKTTAAEVTIPVAVIPVQPNVQAAVIQLPETEPQPLPDELKQAVQQPRVEVKDFQTLVNAATKTLENQATLQSNEVVAPKIVVEAAVAKPAEVIDAIGTKSLDVEEPVVKIVDLKAQPEDLAALETPRTTGGLYALTAAKTENLIQPKTLPMIREISQEVATLAREQGKSLCIQVYPENMGKIDLRLISNSDGMRVVMTAEVPATAKLLENHLDQLQRSLAAAGLSISGMSVSSQGAQGDNPSFSQANPGLAKINRPVFMEEPVAQSPVPVLVSASGLDYRV